MDRNATNRPQPALPEAAFWMEQPLHPSYEELAGFLHAGQGSPQWAATAQHLEICRGCAREVRDLRALDALMDAPVAAPAAKPLGFLDWLRELVAFPQASPAFAASSAFAMLLGALAIWAPTGTPSDAAGNAIHDILRPTDFAAARLVVGWTLASGGAVGLLYNLFSRNKK